MLSVKQEKLLEEKSHWKTKCALDVKPDAIFVCGLCKVRLPLFGADQEARQFACCPHCGSRKFHFEWR